VESARSLMESAGHHLEVAFCPPTIQLHADPTRLSQVFANLLTNAAKYTDDGGRIEITVDDREREVAVSVRDNGIGIPKDEQGHVFDMFAQLQQPRGRTQGGLGIGLTLVKRLVELHGGRVDVASEPGQGSTFTITLPTIASATRIPTPQPATQRRTGSRRILVVDDNRDAARTLRMMLERWGHQVDSAHDGREALERAVQTRPELIFMDIGMPLMNGYEAARAIREEPWGKSVLLVAISGWGQEQDKIRARDAGFDFHIVKPGTADEIQRIISG
jgi:CheY-like chemotaxis protein